MSTPDDETPDEDEELEPDDWSEDSSLWGDEPIERPRAFAEDAEPDEPSERPRSDDPDPDDEPSERPRSDDPDPDDEPSERPRAFADPDDEDAEPDEPSAVPEPPDDAPSRSDERAELLDEASDRQRPAFDTQVEIDGASAPASKRPAPTEPRPTTPPVEVQVAALLADPSKRIVGDLHWSADEDGAQGREFLAPVRCAAGELRVRGQRCAAAGSLRFSLLSRGLGRIAALDLGHPHQTADGRLSGDTHFHRRDTAEQPTLPPLDPDDLAGAWRLFCALTNITHEGSLGDPAPIQETLL